MRLHLVPAVVLSAAFASFAAAHDHPSSAYSNVLIPTGPVGGAVTFITGIGPAAPSNIVHASLEVGYVPTGTPAASLLFQISAMVDGTNKTWDVTGADLGFGAGPGPFHGRATTHALNGLVWQPAGFLHSLLDIQVSTVGGGGIQGTFTQATLSIESNASLTGSTHVLSVSAGGTQKLRLDAGPAHAGKPYLLLGSTSGFAPGLAIPGGTLPLNLDPYLTFTLLHPNAPHLAGSWGTLDGNGRAGAAFTLPAGVVPPALAGLTVHHAFVVLDPSLQGADFISVAAPILLAP